MNATVAAARLHVSGIVQGVGFRPFVHRLANRHGLDGWVRNTSGDVEIALEGESGAIDAFIVELQAHAPPLARIDQVSVENADAIGLHDFTIAESASSLGRQLVAPDVSICSKCERELFDPTNRRHRYPFITCTDCGPRYSVVEAMPYDRARTSMRAFPQCPECKAEYEDPTDRRYHSETNSCPACGPSVRCLRPHGESLGGEPIEVAGALIRAGRIVAVRGVGGFHLAVDATNEDAVSRLRARKRRDSKPLAVMVTSVARASELADVSSEEAAWLTAPERPIVILNERRESAIAPSVSAGLGTIGIMLAYAPLHLLLLGDVGRAVVMTSGNPSGEPLASTLEEATRSLGDIADAYLTHDREIVARIDDSVLRVAESGPILLRRGRGFAPVPVRLPVPTPVPLVAVGPHLKNTFTLAVGDTAFLSPHIGDLETVDTEESWRRTYDSLCRLFDVEPRIAVRDLHPTYLSTYIAERLPVDRVITVQHHHAHVAAVAAEHGVTEPVIGVAFDGTGYGDDGHTWGAEILVADLAEYRRLAHLRYVPLAGGDLAARTPWRSALGYEFVGRTRLLSTDVLAALPGDAISVVRRQLEVRLNTPLASSMGRLFDAVAAILGVCVDTQFEGEAGMRLEALAGSRAGREFPFDADDELYDGSLVFDPLPLLAELSAGIGRGADPADLAADFHASIAAGTVRLLHVVAEREKIRRVVLSGGVFQNARLLKEFVGRLRAARLDVLLPRQLPANDGAISFGQAVVGALRSGNGGEHAGR
jgi:hydrogenase maturation protein HypF